MINVLFDGRALRRLSCAGIATILLSSCGGGGASGDIALQDEYLKTSNANPSPSENSNADVNANSTAPTSTSTSAPAATWINCASEGEACSFSGNRQIRYGANETYVYQTATDSIACTNSVFGDPLPTVFKACAYSI